MASSRSSTLSASWTRDMMTPFYSCETYIEVARWPHHADLFDICQETWHHGLHAQDVADGRHVRPGLLRARGRRTHERRGGPGGCLTPEGACRPDAGQNHVVPLQLLGPRGDEW